MIIKEKFDLKGLAEPIMKNGTKDEMRDMLEEAVGWAYIETARANDAEYELMDYWKNTLEFLKDMENYIKLTTNELNDRIEDYKATLEAEIQFKIDIEESGI